ncbi:MAG: hypothetical protein ACTSQI_13045 [Candidatus Helarchaeota archaeon]
MRKIQITHIGFVIFLFILIFQGFVPNSTNIQSKTSQNPDDFIINRSAHDLLTGIGYGLNYTEYANRTDTSSLSLYYNTMSFGSGSATTTLASNWEGYMMQIQVYDLTQNRTYLDDYDFSAGDPSPVWSEVEVDPGWDNIQTSGAGDDIYIESGTGPDGTACARVQQRGVLNGGYYRFDNYDRAAYSQSITIQGGTIMWAGLDFDYRGDSSWSSSLFHAYVRVGSTEVWSLSYGPLADSGIWRHQDMVALNTTPFSNTINIEIGLQSDASVGYSTRPNPTFRFDNVKLYVITPILPSTVNLQMNGLPITNDGLGNGHVTQIPGTLWQTSPLATFTWATSPNPPVPDLPVTIDFKVAANLFALKTENLLSDLTPGAYGTKYTVQEGQRTEWEMYTLIATPDGYWNHYYNFTIPVDWNFTGLYEPQNPTVNLINRAIAGGTGDGYIQINLTDITNSPAGYWRLTAESPNYVTDVTPTDTGTPQTTFRIGDVLRIRANITNAGTGYANLSLYNPTGALWNTEVLQPISDQFVFSDINLLGPSTPAGEYETVVWWNNRSAVGASDANEAGLDRSTFSVIHSTQLESYDISTVQTDTFADVLYNETFVLKAKYTDVDNGLGIDEATVQIEWIDGVNYTLTGLGGGFYQIDNLNTAQIEGVYPLTIYANKNYFDGATKPITVELVHHTSLIPNATSVTVDWGENTTLQFFYNDTDIANGITGASIWVSNGWQSGNWFNISEGSGYYSITFATTWTSPDTLYDIDISADLANYQLKTRQISIFVRARSSELSYVPPDAPPFRDSTNVTINFVDGVNGTGISNATNQLYFTINSSLNGYSHIYEISPGVFYLEVNTSAPIFTQPGIYTITLNMDWTGIPYYANQSISIKLTVRQITTSLTYDPPGDIPYGNNVDLIVHYTATDTDSQFNGLGLTGAQINITTAGYIYGVNYTVTPHQTIEGDYIITIYNNTLNSINSFGIDISASGLIEYSSAQRSLILNIRKIYTSIIITPPGNVPIGNYVNISLQIIYSDSASQWYNGQPITTLSSGDFAITGGHTFVVYNIGAGYYMFEIDNTTISTLGTYNEYISILEGGLYLSDNRSVSWTIRKLISTITVDPIVDIPYGNDVTATVHAIYDDSASQWYNGQGIPDLSTSDFNVSGGHNFQIVEIGNGDYTLTITNNTILTLQTYSETLTLYTGANFTSDTSSMTFTVRALYTELIADLVPASPIGEDVLITVHYRVKDPISSYYNGNGISGAQINITTGGYSYGTDYSVNDLGNGDYEVTIYSSVLSFIQSYSVALKASNAANYYANATTGSSFDTRAIATSFIYTAPSPSPWGFNVSIDLSFSIEDSLSSQNGNPLDSADLITVNESDPTFIGEWTDLGSGKYQIELNTTGLSMGSYWANISIYKTNYVNRSVLVRFTMRAHFTQVTYDIPDPKPWGKNTTITVYFEDVDVGYSYIHPVSSITVNESQSYTYNWIDNGDGSFVIETDTTDPNLWPVGDHLLEVNVYQTGYQNSSTLITITMKTRDTDLIYETPDITPFLQNSTIKIQYRDLKNSTSPTGINNNTNPQIPGLQYSAGNVSIRVIILDSTLSPVSGATYWIFTMESVSNYGDGWYNITIDTSSLGLTGTYYADITVEWLTLAYYNNQSIRIPFNVRNITALLEYQPPGSTPYAEGGFISVWLKYTDIDNSLPITNASVNIYYIEDPNNTQLAPFTQALGNYTVADQGDGWYLIKIYMGSDKLFEFGSYDFSIRFNKTNYDTRLIANITFAIRQGYTQFTSPYAPLSYVINGIVNITVNYIDSESGIGIVNTTSGDPVILTWSWPYNASFHPDVMYVFGWSNSLSRWIPSGNESNYPMGDDGRYQLQINFTKIPVGNRTMISLNITAGRNVQSQVLNITFIIEPQTSVMGVTFPQPVVWGVNSEFNVTYQKIDGTGIPGTVIDLWDLDRGEYWNSSYWSSIELYSSVGLFGITVNTTLHPPPESGFFRIRVDASGGPYTPRSLNVFLNVRPIDSQVTLTPPAASGWNTLTNITIQYYDTYNSVPINDSDITDSNDVIINITNIPRPYWTLYNGESNGYYIVEINTSYWSTLNEIGHTVYIDVSWEGIPYYKNWSSLTVGVPVRSRNTDLSYTPPLQIPYGENSSIIFEWRDLEISGGVGIENTSGKVIFELRDWLNQAWNSSGFAWVTALGNGQYQVQINSSQLPSIGSYTFTAYFSWPGQPFYSNRSLSFSINVRQINTILTYGIPAATPYGNPFVLHVQFNISDTSSLSNGAYIEGAIINITSISNSGGPLSTFSYGNNYSVTDNGQGSYTITIFNQSLTIDSYSISLMASRYNIEFIYKNATASLSFSVRALTTTLNYVSPLPVPWGNNVSISFNYQVSDSESLYWDGVGLDVASWVLNNGTIWVEGLQYSISGSAGSYSLSIDSASVYGNNIGTFTFDITASEGSNRFINASISNIPFIVRALTTVVSYTPTTPVPFGNNVTVNLFCNVSDSDSWYYNGQGLNVNTWILSNSSGIWNESEYLISGSGGVYTLTLFANVYSSIGTFTFDILTDFGSNIYENATSSNVPFTIRALTTALTYIPATPEPYGNNVTIIVKFNVSDPASTLYNGLGLDVSSWTLSNISGSWTEGTEYIISGGSGLFVFTIINNVYQSIGAYTLDIQASAGSAIYQIASFNNIPFTIRALTTALTYIPSTPEPFGNNITLIVRFNVSDPASINYNGMGLNVSSFSLANTSGAWNEGIEYIQIGTDGIFEFTILNDVYASVGNYYFNIHAISTRSIYTVADLTNVIFTIRALSTALSIIPATPVPFGNNVTGLRVFFNVSDPDSSFNGQGLDGIFSLSNISGSWTENLEYLVTGTGGIFDFTILSVVYNTVGAYSFDIQVSPSSSIYSAASFSNVPFTIRKLITSLSYIPTLPTPFGNNVTLQVLMNISDSASVLFDGMGLAVTTWTVSNTSGSWTENVEYLVSGASGAYTFTIMKEIYSSLGSYSFDITADTGSTIYETASLTAIPFTIRSLITAVSYNPTITQPFGNNVTIDVFFNIADTQSANDGLGLDVVWLLSNVSGQWTEGIEYVVSGGAGVYHFIIINSVYNDVGSYTFDILGAPSEFYYSNASFSGVPFTIRALITAISWIPIDTQPWGNPVNATILYNVSDPVSTLFNGMPLEVSSWSLSNSTSSWFNGVEYTVSGGSGVFLFTIDNDTVASDVGSYTFNVVANSGNTRYQSASISGIPFTIRPLRTRLTYTPVPNVPWGNNVTIDFLFNVSDAASLWYNNKAINGATLTITRPGTWTVWTDYISTGGNGAYTLEISNETLNIVQSYSIDVQASTGSLRYEDASILSLPFTIRELATVLIYEAVSPVPYGNPVNITIHFIVSDPESDWYDGLGVPLDNFNITSPGVWNYTLNWTYSGSNGDYVLTIFNNTANHVGSYTVNVIAIPLNPVYSTASFNNIPYSIRALNTFLTYPTPAKFPWGDNATIDLRWQVIDSASLYHNGEYISGGMIEVTNPSNWTYWIDYVSKDFQNGNYILNISKDTVNKVQTYIIDLKVYHLSADYYGNTTYTGLPFSILYVTTSHTTLINSTYYLDGIGGWPWGDLVNVTVFYNDTDHGTLVPNSNISIHGDSGTPFESGNFTINGVETTVAGSAIGIFTIIINGTVAENAIGYNFYIELFHPTGNYLNHSYIFTISFRKSVSQVILKNPPVFIPWGDNITIIFTYNNSEAPGFPGIPGADVNVTVNIPAASASYIFYEAPAYGPGTWIIEMNTTWANVTYNLDVEITFTITAVAPQTIVAQSFHTVFIQPLDSDIRAVAWDSSTFLETTTNFNITVELRDRSHFNSTEGDFNLIVNNSYWTTTGSPGQYDNVHFIIKTREGAFNNYTWYWGNVSVLTLSPGLYQLTFFFNQTPDYPEIQELLDYLIIVEVRGDRLDSSETQVSVDLKLKTHETAMTFDWGYANSTITPAFALAPFQSFINGSSYIYGDYINVYLYWWDLDSGDTNPGISAAYITTNWTNSLYYRVFNLYDLNDQNESYKGIFWIQIDTNLFQNMIRSYTLYFNATLETYQRIYLLTQGFINFQIDPVPVNFSLQEPILSIPYQDNAEIKIRVTNLHENNSGIFLTSSDIDIINIPGVMGGAKWLVGTNPLYGEYSLFFYTTAYDIGVYNATVRINKTNHEVLTKNFTFEIREIDTRIILQTTQNLTITHRLTELISFLYWDNESYSYHAPIGAIPFNPLDPDLDFNISNWYNRSGVAQTLTDEVNNGVYKIEVNASIDVGYYIVSIYVKLPHYELATYQLSINITKASTQISPVDPPSIYSSFSVFKFFKKRFAVQYLNQFSEPIENATLFVEIYQGNITGPPLVNLTLKDEGNGLYGIDLSTLDLDAGVTYSIRVVAYPNLKNYAMTLLDYPNIFTIKPIWEHWSFILLISVLAAVAGVVAYRRIKWYLTPYQVKAIIRATKTIKKGKEAEVPVVKSRNELFRSEFAQPWSIIELKPPKLAQPEIVLFASELSAIIRSRITTPEAEKIVIALRSMSLEDASRYLSEMKVPPEATRRLLTIIGIIEKERMEIVTFAQLLGEIKGIEISYSQAEEIINAIQSMSPVDADKYLEAMVIPQEERKRLLELAGIKPFVPKGGKASIKIKESKYPSKEEISKSFKTKPRKDAMDLKKLKAELDKIPHISEAEKETLIEDLKNLSREEQEEILDNLRE